MVQSMLVHDRKLYDFSLGGEKSSRLLNVNWNGTQPRTSFDEGMTLQLNVDILTHMLIHHLKVRNAWMHAKKLGLVLVLPISIISTINIMNYELCYYLFKMYIFSLSKCFFK